MRGINKMVYHGLMTTMEKIEALIRPEKLSAVKTALNQLGLSGMTISDVQGAGGQEPGHREVYRGKAYNLEFLPRLKLELVVSQEQVDETCTAIANAARTGMVGDGKIIVTPVHRIVRIRTGEEGTDATQD